MGVGAKLWEKMNPDKVRKEKALSEGGEYQTYEDKKEPLTKTSTPAGGERNIQREDTSNRRKVLDKVDEEYK